MTQKEDFYLCLGATSFHRILSENNSGLIKWSFSCNHPVFQVQHAVYKIHTIHPKVNNNASPRLPFSALCWEQFCKYWLYNTWKIKGSELPALQKDTLRIYSMRYCPYAQRTRMVLVHKNIPCETVNVNLKRKPDWFLARNPLGLVPILEYNDQLVYESVVCDDFLDEVYPEKKLYPADPYAKARQKILIELCGKVTAAFFKLLRADKVSEDRPALVEKLVQALQPYEDALQGKFFGGGDLNMVDIHLWPWFERFAIWKNDSASNVLPADRLPRLNAYVDNMLRHPTVQATMYDARTHTAFFNSYFSGDPKYDDL